MKNVATYQDTTLETDKRINLIYGLNGSGKTQLSNCLKNWNNLENTVFKECSIENVSNNEDIFVYNQSFIDENFYETDKQKGIFTLSEQNKTIEEKISKYKDRIKKMEDKIQQYDTDISGVGNNETKLKNDIEDKLWKEVYQQYNSTEFAYCLQGYGGAKSRFFDKFVEINCMKQIDKTINDLKIELKNISNDSLPENNVNVLKDDNIQTIIDIEQNNIFSENIIGSEHSQISALIEQLGNSDWVRQGVQFIDDNNQKCPFCQKETIDKNFRDEIKQYFDTTYEDKIQELKQLKTNYENAKKGILKVDDYLKNKFIKEQEDKFRNIYNNIVNNIDSNLRKISGKIEKPNNSVVLSSSSEFLKQFDNFINDINKNVNEYNDNLNRKQEIKSRIKDDFLKIIRNKYNDDYRQYRNNIEKLNEEKNKKERIKGKYELVLNKRKEKIVELQKQTKNLQQAVDSINNNLQGLGMIDFSIVPENIGENNYFYKIVRNNMENEKVFHSLSEGEKTIISFLYFMELCKGQIDENNIINDKIIVIDDPISSLSNNYIFDVAHFIRKKFIENSSNFKQLFVLTHSLYFFHELDKIITDDKQKKNTKKFRIKRNNTNHSEINKLKNDEILNDYQEFWNIYKNKDKYPQTILPNVMRNIIEYFFSYIGNGSYQKVIAQLENEKNQKYTPFIRFVNRKSHSDLKNMDMAYDTNSIDIGNFIETFEKIFDNNDIYKEHYNKMMT